MTNCREKNWWKFITAFQRPFLWAIYTEEEWAMRSSARPQWGHISQRNNLLLLEIHISFPFSLSFLSRKNCKKKPSLMPTMICMDIWIRSISLLSAINWRYNSVLTIITYLHSIFRFSPNMHRSATILSKNIVSRGDINE